MPAPQCAMGAGLLMGHMQPHQLLLAPLLTPECSGCRGQGGPREAESCTEAPLSPLTQRFPVLSRLGETPSPTAPSNPCPPGFSGQTVPTVGDYIPLLHP